MARIIFNLTVIVGAIVAIVNAIGHGVLVGIVSALLVLMLGCLLAFVVGVWTGSGR